MNRKNRYFYVKSIVFAIIIFIFILFTSTIFSILNANSDKIIKGTYIENNDISNLSLNELEEKLEKIVNENNSQVIKFKYDEFESSISIGSLNLDYKTNEVKNKLYKIGRNNNIFISNYQIFYTKFFKYNYRFNLNLSEEEKNSLFNSLCKELPNTVKQPEFYIDDNRLIITRGKKGIVIDNNKLNSLINEKINEFNNNEKVIVIPTLEEEPEAIDIEKIHQAIYKDVQDACITDNPVTVHPDVTGVDFDMDINKIKEMLKENKEEYVIPLKFTKANKTIKDLGEDAFPNNLGSFTTKYDVQNENRANNIKIATEKINEQVIMPGEVFSYNQTVGKRTIESGYKEAGSYLNGQVVQEIGGGICQVSSTLYNAALYANLEIIERYNHYFESSYVEPGRDATVSWGSVDFKFKNNRKYPIKISAISKNGVESVSINGIKEENEYKVIIQSKIISKIERKVNYVEDGSLEQGKELIVQSGHDGCISETYKLLKLNDKIISNTKISTDRYNALERIIKKETK